MPVVLKNKNIEIQIDLPQSDYDFSRFDWTGKIVSVTWKNTLVSGMERPDSVDENKIGKGFYNEFGLHKAVGFDETPEGEWFHKIGIGLLKKEGSDYVFSRSYEIQPAGFTVKSLPEKVQIICQSKPYNGYSYILEKEIVLNENGFTIQYSLKNTGKKDIVTNEYVHNFISINKDLIGKDYILNFPFEIKPDLFEGNVNPEGIVQIGQKEITFTDTPKEQFYLGNLSGSEEVTASWEVRNLKAGIGIRESGDFKTTRVNLWGWGHVVSPELFFDISLKPGEEIRWSRTYTVFELN